MHHGIIFDLRRYAVHDGPGIRTTVFFKGCPLGCLWCHNPESQAFAPQLMLQQKLCISCGRCHAVCPGGTATAPLSASCSVCCACSEVCPTGARLRVGQTVTAEQLMPLLLRDRPFYDQSGGGVTFSGGEPLAQPEILLDLLKRCGKEEVHRALDTSGYAAPELVRAVAAECELFLYDLKLIESAQHRRYTGVDNALILSNLRLLAELGAKVILRVPLIPGINDTAMALQQLAVFVKELQQPWPLQLLPYHRLPESKYAALGREYALSEIAPPSKEVMENAARLLRAEGVASVLW